jgi:hypothetical protein
MKSFQNKQIFYSILLASLLSLPVKADIEKRREYSSHDNRESSITIKEVALGATGIVLGAAGCYVIARLCSSGLYSVALYHYEAELDLLLRSVFNEQVLQEELIPFVLEQHDRNNSLYFFIQSKYKNYPLLYYKNNLDWYINRLWLSKFLYHDNQARHKVDVLVQKLERIRRLVVTDYRFVKEQRDFDKQERKIKGTD